MSVGAGDRFQTSLGPAAERHGGTWTLDLTALPLLHGLSVLSRSLGEAVLERARTEPIDVTVERTVNARENPELLHVLGVAVVKVCAEHETIAGIAGHADAFQEHLRALFGTLQRQAYREALFPRDGSPSRALVFTFAFDGPPAASSLRFVLERLAWSRAGGWCLRITIEDPSGRRLALDSIAHRHVDAADLAERTFIAGSTRIAQTWREGIRRETERGRRAYLDVRKPYAHVFAQFAKAGLAAIEQIGISWPDAVARRVVDMEPAELDHLLKRTLLALEDRGIRRLLDSRETVRIVCDDMSVFLDVSHLGRMLNVSLGQRRERLVLDEFLARMPAVAGRVAGLPLAGVKVFLIHHMTAEVLGLIAALRTLGCRDLVTLFVTYAGEAPASYLGPLLDLPPDECRFLGLSNVPDEESVEGRYRLSSQYSRLSDDGPLVAALARGRLRYLEAMQTVALQEFVHQAARAERAGERCLVIEDGGYLAPLLNDEALRGTRVCDLLAAWHLESADDRPLATALAPLIGSVEHTRNGHNRLARVETAHGTLAWPAFSIAISRLKLGEESREVAISILNAVENVLHAGGRVLSRRTCLVLGSRGAIGSCLVDALRTRLAGGERQMCGVDLRAADAPPDADLCERTSYAALPLDWRRRVDLVLGVTGTSVLVGDDVEAWLLEGESPELVLASGSTKTEEFSGIAAWLDQLLREPVPNLRGCRATVTVEPLADAVSGRVFGHRYRFSLDAGDGRTRVRDLHLLANLTPVNFLFYGVPTEVIDAVLGQLLGCALGLARRTSERPPARLSAVDREITPDGEPLGSAAAPAAVRPEPATAARALPTITWR